jgi:nucleotide-binding universal stress UspA family protein
MNDPYQYFVPVEFSDKASVGVELAVMLAEKTGATVNMIHSMGNDKRYSDRKFFKEKLAYSTKIIQRLINYYQRKTNDNVDFTFKIITEDLNSYVIQLANNTDESAISYGIKNNYGIMTKSSIQKIISSSLRPVFTTNSAVPNTVSNIILPLDTHPETKIKVPFTARIAKKFNAQVHILGLQTSGEDSKKIQLFSQQVSSFFEEEGISFRSSFLKGNNIVDMITYYADKICADMISVMANPEKNFYNFFAANNTVQLIQKSPVPLILVPSRKPIIKENDIPLKKEEMMNP